MSQIESIFKSGRSQAVDSRIQLVAQSLVKDLSKWEEGLTYPELKETGGELTFSAIQHLFELNILDRRSNGTYTLSAFKQVA